MAIGYVIPVDPAELANRFSSDPYEEIENLDDPDPVEGSVEAILADGNYEERIAPLLNRIPEREADLIHLYFIQKKRQADIAEIFEITQAAVSYRLERGLKRIKFLLSIPTVTEDDLRRDLPEIFKNIDVDILVGMWQTTCQSQVAEDLGLTQGRVRHRFFKAVKTLEIISLEEPKFVPYSKIFSAISHKNFNILKSVILPQWSSKGMDSIF